MYYTKEQAADRIKAAYSEIKPMYDQTAEKSRAEYMANLPVGQPIPQEGIIYGETNKGDFKNFVSGQRQKALSTLSDYRDSIDDSMAAAPTDEALRAVQAFALRDPDSMTREEYADQVDRLMKRYGGNYTAYMTLYDMAVKKGILDFKKHPLAYEAEDIGRLEREIPRYFDSFEMLYHGAPSNGNVMMFNSTVDRYLSE